MKKLKILYITTVGETMAFFKSFIKELYTMGNTVDIACNYKESIVPECYKELGCQIFYLPCSRVPFDGGNITAARKIHRLVGKKGYDIVHCHTPIAAFCTRIACINIRRHGTKVFYTAHGFHFYTGASLKNWLVYYPVEWLCSWWTDVLITINREDYERAKIHLHAKKTEYVPGVGIDLIKFNNVDCNKKRMRNELGLMNTDIMLLSVGELNENKNHIIVIEALGMIKKECPNIFKKLYYFVAGDGKNKLVIEKLAEKKGIREHVKLLGVVDNIPEFLSIANIFLLPSKREGLNVSLMEAMASGLPCIVSDIRGNIDLIRDDAGGKRVGSEDVRGWMRAIVELTQNIKSEGFYNLDLVSKFSIENVKKKLYKIYFQ